MDLAVEQQGHYDPNTTYGISQGFYRSLQNAQDPTLTDFPLVASPLPTLIILCTYVTAIKIIGPAIMQFREPINPTIWINCYNIYQIVANTILCYATVKLILHPENDLTCLRLDRASALIVYYYYVNKMTDLIETFFFLVKKSWRQITFLHVYHHVGVILCNYLDIYFQPGGQTLYLILLNTLAHAIMYTYYLFSNWKPMQKLKKFVTQIQMVQFVIGIMICAGSIAYTSCQKLDWLMFLGVTQYTFLIYIFGIFYKKNYLKKKSL